MTEKSVVVTGANGFIGAAICKFFSNSGVKVYAVVNESSENIENLENVVIVRAEKDNIRDIVGNDRVSEFYHLAWVGSAGPLRADENVQLSNIQNSCSSIRTCRELGCTRFIFASSIMEYEVNAVMDSELVPGINTIYSTAKLTADYMLRAIAGSIGVDYIRAVISNIYGPGETSPRMVNTSIRKMLNGEHCAFSEGKQIYDFIYIDDAAEAFCRIGEKGISNRTYYIGSLNPKPLREFLIEMRDAIDPQIEIGLGEIPFSGVSLTYKEFDVNAVKNDTGFEPKVSFKEGIKRTAMWIKNNN
ncbi:NAD-dependent epimerase/dehydratase family protein [Lachnoanaerobaculum sp. JCM 36186]|uniref:NAD-dependent epimerase/dehydratase family protein n=1 Tax=Lachnoanaerobaculum sanguinis TaxID=3065809 RepID=UPI002750C8D5|nr:NAD(P)-dependent oxidoreductase [Lachnoanaerobaculum sp. JCM 36186]GMO02404.1 NAD-dependent epimerase/dehydratase family protein [Lachnoanaerobaculum sp. JCM 36186]